MPDQSKPPPRPMLAQQRRLALVALVVFLIAGLAVLGWRELGAAAWPDRRAEALPDTVHDGHAVQGIASYYGYALAGEPTASGEAFDPQKLTAAHRTLPLGTRVRVTNLRTGQSVVVRINDRGPFAERRILDVSRAAAERLGMLRRGKARVRLEVLKWGDD